MAARSLLRSSRNLRTFELHSAEITIDPHERAEDIQLLSTPSYTLQHSLTSFNFEIDYALHDLLAAKIISTGSIIRLRLVKSRSITPSTQFFDALREAMPRLTHFHFSWPSDQDRSLEKFLPLLSRCRSFHLDRININFLPSLEILPALEQFSIYSHGLSNLGAILAELSGFVVERKETLRKVHARSEGDLEKLLVREALGRFRKLGIGTRAIEPPAW